MKKKSRSELLKRHIYITAAVLTLAALALVFSLVKHQQAAVAPVYVMKVSGMTAQTPEEAQAQCRQEYRKFKDISDEHSDVSWAWSESGELYLVKTSAVTLMAESKYPDFSEIKFKDRRGAAHVGYIVDITDEPKELCRIELEPAEEYKLEQVSMSIRERLRSGEISCPDAVFLWEKGSGEVLAVKKDSYEIIEKNIVSFADDGGRVRICYILDTKI